MVFKALLEFNKLTIKKMKIIKLVVLVLFLSSCAGTGNKYTPVGQKKSTFNIPSDSDCNPDDMFVKGLLARGFVCKHENGIIFIRNHIVAKFDFINNDMQTIAQAHCDLFHKDKKAMNKGKPNLDLFSKLDWTGIEFICN